MLLSAATIVLALATLRLWAATRDAARDADRASEAALRVAQLDTEPVISEAQNPNLPIKLEPFSAWSLRITNFGRTSATGERVSAFATEIVRGNHSIEPSYATELDGAPQTPLTLLPNENYTVVWSPADIDRLKSDIANGVTEAYYFGEFRFADVYKGRHVFRYCTHITFGEDMTITRELVCPGWQGGG